MNALERIKNIQFDIPGLLRGLGVVTMLLSGFIFLFQGLSGMDQFIRFLSFSGVTLGSALLGILCAKKLDEPKGARCLLALATAGTFVLFSQFGALLYEWMHPQHLPKVPELLQMTKVTLNQLLIAAGVTATLGALIAYLGFSILERKNSKTLTLSFLLLNIVMALPYRNIDLVMLALTLLIGILIYLRQHTHFLDTQTFTLEKGTVIGLLTIPVVTMLYRSSFYEFDRFFVATHFVLLAAIAGTFELYKSRESFGIVSVPLTMIGLIVAMNEVPLHYRIAINLIISHGAIVFLAKRQSVKVHQWLSTIWFLSSVFLASLILDDTKYAVTTTGFIIALCALHQGRQLGEKAIFKTGIGLLVISVCSYVLIAIKHVNAFHWINLAIFAAIALVTASVIERLKNKN